MPLQSKDHLFFSMDTKDNCPPPLRMGLVLASLLFWSLEEMEQVEEKATPFHALLG